ncbi:MAG TPA: hypothetical protein ENN22_09190 [bacterium]|nr:hypothetical protein [bacterium]
MIIGLTGSNAAGKSTVVDFLVSQNFEAHSLSDIIRDELRQRQLPASRENLIQAGNELRTKFGASVLADRVKNKIQSDNAVIDSIRNTEEVRSLRQLNNFFLVSVDAPVELRFRWAKTRGRVENASTLEQFIALENREKSATTTAQNIAACMAKADYQLINNNSIDELHNQVRKMVADLQKRKRPSWDHYFMKMAFLVAERSTCLRHHVGAIIVKDRKVLTTGYNGAARNLDDCLKLGCLRDQLKIASGERHEICRAIHAEQNAIIQAGVHGTAIYGGTIYCTHSPCIICAKMIVNAGVVRVVTCSDYPDDFSLAIDLFKQAGIEIVRIEPPTMQIKMKP